MFTDVPESGMKPRWVRRALPWALLGLLVIGGGVLAIRPPAHDLVTRMTGWLHGPGARKTSLEGLDQYGLVPDFSLIERSGRQVTLADLLGKVWIANFFYTECTDTCPLQSANMARLQDELAGEAGVRLVSISVDPEHDTPEVLSEYAVRFGANPDRWLFFTGAREAIYRLAIKGFRLGVVERREQAQRRIGKQRVWLGPTSAWAHPLPNVDREPVLHSSRFVLVDQQAQIRAYHHGTDWKSLERLQENVKIVLREQPKER